MQAAGISTGELVNGSLVLTRQKALERGVQFHETLNQMTGDKTELMQTRLSSISMSLMRNCDGSGAGTEMGNGSLFCPTPDSIMRMDALQAQVAEDTPAVEQALSECLAQAGIDPNSDFSMTVDYDADGKSRIHIGKDNAQWQDIEAVLNNNKALHCDVMRTWNQQDLLREMQVVARVLNESAPSGQEAINTAWRQYGQADLGAVRQNAAVLSYTGGKFVFSGSASA